MSPCFFTDGALAIFMLNKYKIRRRQRMRSYKWENIITSSPPTYPQACPHSSTQHLHLNLRGKGRLRCQLQYPSANDQLNGPRSLLSWWAVGHLQLRWQKTCLCQGQSLGDAPGREAEEERKSSRSVCWRDLSDWVTGNDHRSGVGEGDYRAPIWSLLLPLPLSVSLMNK